MKRGTLLSILVLLIVLLGAQVAFANVSGAIFTTNEDGTWVNGNTKYMAKEDVYLDGGPGPNAPSKAAALDPGWYYFQVTDPSGKFLLSEDPVECRQFHVTADGWIDEVYQDGVVVKKVRGELVEVPCVHQTGIDTDYGDLGALTVQLMPYKDTPNRGGVYKVWATPIEKFVGDPKQVDNPDYFHGFVPAWSKTDNYKVKGRIIPPEITVKKFHDWNANRVWDVGEPSLTWWVDITEPGMPEPTTGDWTPFTYVAAEAGVYAFTETMPDVCPPWEQTALYIDGILQPVSKTAYLDVAGTSGETHEIIFGNVQKVCVKAEKFYDRNANGVKDEGEGPVAGIKFILRGTNVKGETVYDEQFSGADGTYTWCDLYAGTYSVEEILPSEKWIPTTPTLVEKAIAEGATGVYRFGNCCTCWVGFYTKGYWHNKNGLAALTVADRDYANGLLPYSAPSDYFSAGDEPFDGYFADGTPVAEAFNDDGLAIWAAGTWQSEISHFLVDNNGDGGPREQLAQQLLAFVFNVRHQAGMGASLIGPGGTVYPAADLISDAIGVWNDPAGDWSHMAGLLDWFNNHHADEGCPLQIICAEPCYPIVY